MAPSPFKHINLQEALGLIRRDEVESTFPRQLVSLMNEALQPYLEDAETQVAGGTSLNEVLLNAMLDVDSFSKQVKASNAPDVAHAYQKGQLFHALCSLGEPLDTPDLNALFLYQLDHLVGQSLSGNLDGALYTFVDMMGISWFRESILVEESHELSVRKSAQRSARIRHTPLSEIKTKVVKHWEEARDEYKSQADFARIISKLYGLKERTTYDWISAYKKHPSN